MLALGLGLGAMHAVTAPAYAAAGRAVPGGLGQLAREAMPLARSVEFLTGPPDRLDTVAGYLSYKVFPTSALTIAIWAGVQGVNALRGSERSGLVDLWIAAGVSRAGVVRARIAGFAAALLAICALLWAGTVVGAAIAGEHIAAAAVLQCAGVATVAVLAYAVGLALSQLTAGTRSAAAGVAAWTVASYVVANLGDSLGGFGFLRYLTPFTAYIDNRALVPGLGLEPVALLLPLAAAAALVRVAAAGFVRRDVGRPLLAVPPRSPSAREPFRPSRVRRRALWIDGVTEQWGVVAAWFAGVVAFTTLETSFVTRALKVIRDIAGGHAALEHLTVTAYVAAVVALCALFACAFAVQQTARWAADAGARRDDLVLSQPVSWRSFVAARAASLLVASLLGVTLPAVLGISAGARIAGVGLDGGGIARAALAVTLVAWAVGGTGVALVALLRRGAAAGLLAGLIVLTVAFGSIAEVLGWPAWAGAWSVIRAFGSPYESMPGLGSLLYLAALGATGAAVALVLLRSGRRVAA